MALPELLSNHNMGYGRLVQRADSLSSTMNRDKTELKDERGVTAERAATLLAARNALSEFPTDEELLVDVSEAAENKTISRRAVEISIRAIRGKAEIKFGKDSIRYKAFRFDDLTRLEDHQLVRCGRRVVRMATRYLAQLESEGLTETQIETLKAQNDQFDLDIDLVDAAEEERDDKTQERITLGNTLFERISEFARIGQQLWADRDEAKYNDYIIDDSPDEPAEIEATES